MKLKLLLLIIISLEEHVALGKHNQAHKRVTASRQHYLKKVKENAELLDYMKNLAGDFTIGPVGNLNINLVGTYMKCKEIGEIREKLAMNEEGAVKEMIEAISTLILFDIPGVASPIIDAFKEILLEKDHVPSTDIQHAIENTNKHVRKVLKKGAKPIKQRIDSIGKGLHEMSEYVGKSIDEAIDNRLKPKHIKNLKAAGKAANAFLGEASEKLGSALTKIGGVMNVLSMTYSLYKLGDSAAEKDWDSVIEYGLVFAASVLTIIGTNAAIGSAFGPLGIVAGVVVGGIAAIYGIVKPDPKGDLREDMMNARLISEKSIKYLHQDFELLPDVVSNLVSGGPFHDWIFESNQYILKNDVKGLTPNTPFKFAYNNAESPPYITDRSVCDDWNRLDSDEGNAYTRIVDSGFCVPIGETRKIDKEKYKGFYTTLEGYEDLKQPHDFYGYVNESIYTGTTIMLRTNLLESSDEMRKINIDTKLPNGLWGVQNILSHDDTLVLYDMGHMLPDANTPKVKINLRGGNDTVIVNGRIGKSTSGQAPIVDISFHSDDVSVGSKDDFGGMISFTGMNENKTFYANILERELAGIEFKPKTVEHNRAAVCYHWISGEKTCPITTSAVAIFGCSPLRDIIHLNSDHNMLIINDEGINTYNVEIPNSYPIRAYQIADKSPESATIKITSPTGLVIAYIEREGAYEIYREKHLKVRINYKASKHIPHIFLNNNEIQRDTFLKKRTHLNRHAPATKPRFLYEYKYDGNVEIQKSGIQWDSKSQSVCMCPLIHSEVESGEGYWTIKMTNKVDALVFTRLFFEQSEEQKLNIKVVYDRVSDDADGNHRYGWQLQIRKKTDFNNAEYPRYDIQLKSVEVLKYQDNSVLFDLTDHRSLTYELNILHRYKTITQYVFGSNCNDHADRRLTYGADDYLVMKNQKVSGSSWNEEICDLGDGNNILVVDTTSMLEDLKYQIVEAEITFDRDEGEAEEVEEEEGQAIMLRELKIFHGGKHVKFHNIDRFVCQFEGGLQRDLPKFTERGVTADGEMLDLAQDCAAVRPTEHYGGTTQHGYQGIHNYVDIEESHCDNRCD